MRALILTAQRRLELLDRCAAELLNGEVRLRVEAAGICGSDVHGFAGLNDRRPVGVVMGHETIGRVVEVKTGAITSLQVGNLVAVNPVVSCGECARCSDGRDNLCDRRRLYGCSLELDGGLASEMVVRAENCVLVEEQANLLGLAWIEPMAVGTHAVRKAEAQLGSRVLVIGGGPIGIATSLAWMVENGVSPLISEPAENRRLLAESLGIPTCSPADLEDMQAHFDVAVECVGSGATVRSAVASVRAGGTIVCLGLAESEVAIPAVPLVVGERRLIGSSAYTKEDFGVTARWVASRSEELAALANPISLDAMPGAFAGYVTGELQAMKTLYIAER